MNKLRQLLRHEKLNFEDLAFTDFFERVEGKRRAA